MVNLNQMMSYKGFRVGDKVEGTDYDQNPYKKFTGVIKYISMSVYNSGIDVDVLRDDKVCGAGYDRTWSTRQYNIKNGGLVKNTDKYTHYDLKVINSIITYIEDNIEYS